MMMVLDGRSCRRPHHCNGKAADQKDARCLFQAFVRHICVLILPDLAADGRRTRFGMRHHICTSKLTLTFMRDYTAAICATVLSIYFLAVEHVPVPSLPQIN
jgi:hypothetical protein